MSEGLARRASDDDGDLRVGRYFSVGPDGLTVLGNPSFDSWERLVHGLRRAEQGLQFAIGDALRLGKERWGDRADQVIDPELGWSLSTIRVYEWVSGRVPFENRRTGTLTWAHHQAVAALTPAEQRQWLAQAEGDGETPAWPVARLKSAIRNGSDPEEVAWFLVVRCDGATARAELRKRLEAEGFVCTATDKRGQQKQAS